MQRILIIEDDREAAAYLVKAFREAGHVADHAADGLDGYGMASSGDYDVLIVDRSQKQFRLTREGRSLYEASKDILNRYEQVASEMQEMRKVVMRQPSCGKTIR
mgnify:CR=1 FL=1